MFLCAKSSWNTNFPQACYGDSLSLLLNYAPLCGHRRFHICHSYRIGNHLHKMQNLPLPSTFRKVIVMKLLVDKFFMYHLIPSCGLRLLEGKVDHSLGTTGWCTPALAPVTFQQNSGNCKNFKFRFCVPLSLHLSFVNQYVIRVSQRGVLLINIETRRSCHMKGVLRFQS